MRAKGLYPLENTGVSENTGCFMKTDEGKNTRLCTYAQRRAYLQPAVYICAERHACLTRLYMRAEPRFYLHVNMHACRLACSGLKFQAFEQGAPRRPNRCTLLSLFCLT